MTAYNKTKIPVLGKCILRVFHKGKMIPLMFVVADTDSMAILGLDTCEKLNLVKRVMLVNKENSEREFANLPLGWIFGLLSYFSHLIC